MARMFEYDGDTRSLTEWAKWLGTSVRTLRRHLEKNDWNPYLVFGKKLHPSGGPRGQPRKHDGGTMAELAAARGMSYQTVRRRMQLGWSFEQALALPDHRLREHRRTHPPLDLAREADSGEP